MTALPDFRHSRWAPLAALLTTSVLATACGSGGDDAGGGASGKPKSGGTLIFAVSSDAGCVDPQQSGSNESIYSVRQTVDSLTDQDPETGTIVPWLAKSWDINADATEFTFRLRPGVTFSDGSELTAQVVKDTFEAVPNLGALGSLPQGYPSSVKSTTVVDPLTVKVTFKEPNAQFLQATSTHSLGIESSASVKKSPQQKCSDGVIGSGPFVLKQYVQNDHPGQAHRLPLGLLAVVQEGRGLPGQAGLQGRARGGCPGRQSPVRAGQRDQQRRPGQRGGAGRRSGHPLATANPGVVFGLGINNSRPVFKDAKVRQASRRSGWGCCSSRRSPSDCGGSRRSATTGSRGWCCRP